MWMIRMMVPITFGVAILKWLGIIEFMAQWLAPVLERVGLSAEGALVFITSALTSLYSSIALIATLNIDFRQATILAVMGLICHNLIVETLIQRKAGANATYMVLLRLTSAIVAGVALNLILPQDYSGTLLIEHKGEAVVGLGAILYQWLISMAYLIPTMMALIITLNILQRLLRDFGLIDYLTTPLKPLMNLLGLSRESSFLWIIMNTVGLAYGGAVLISEYEAGEVSPTEARLLNTHVALSHSLLEDTLLFAAIGIGAFWLFIPRIVLAIAAVWGERLYNKLTTNHSR